MNLDESIKVFEKYFNGKLTKSPTVIRDDNSRYVVGLTIGNEDIRIFQKAIHWGILNVKSIYISKLATSNSIDEYMSAAAVELKNILDGNPTKTNIQELAVNYILEMLDGGKGTLHGIPTVANGELTVEVHKSNSVPEDSISALKNLKSVYKNDIYTEELHGSYYIGKFSYLFSI